MAKDEHEQLALFASVDKGAYTKPWTVAASDDEWLTFRRAKRLVAKLAPTVDFDTAVAYGRGPVGIAGRFRRADVLAWLGTLGHQTPPEAP